MKTAVLYIRMSTEKESQDNSIASQEEVLLKYAENNNMKVLKKYIDEGISGRSAQKRPSFMQMIEDSEDGTFQYVLVYDSSRFARNLEESIVYKSTLKKNGVALISITEPNLDDDTALITDAMMGAINEMYSRKLSKSVKRGMKYMASQGYYQVPPPFGYKKKNNIMEIIEDEAKIVQFIFEKYLEKPTYYSIAVLLNDMNITTRTGKAFRTTDVKRILKNTAYKGKVNYDDEIYKGLHEPIIEEEMFNQVAKIIASRPKRTQRPSTTYKHYLSGLIKCYKCGSSMNYATDSRGNTSYRCSGNRNGKCKYANFMSVPKLEKLLFDTLSEIITSDELEKYEFFVQKETDNIELDFFKESLVITNKKLNRAKEAYLNGIDSIEEYKENKKNLINEIGIIEKEISILEEVPTTEDKLHIFKEKVRKIIKLLKSDKFTIEEKSIGLKEVINRIILDKYDGKFRVYYYM